MGVGRAVHSDPTLVILQEGVDGAAQGLDGQGLGRPVEGCPPAMVEPVAAPVLLHKSTFITPELLLLGPHPMFVLHQAASSVAARGSFVPDVDVSDTVCNRVPAAS